MSVEEIFGNAPAKTVLAPMAGYTDVAFRSICRDFGVALTVTEMVSSKALVMNNSLSKLLLAREPNDSPCAAQIFGHEPDVMAESVQLEEFRNFDMIDINMGCPVRKIVSNGDGSALPENPKLASRIIQSVKIAAKKPVSVKFRLGVDNGNGAADFAKLCADSGADFITVHFRTRRQMYAGAADFSLLPSIAACGIPVIANGDVSSREGYLKLLDMGAYGVAVGRGALGRPYLFAEIAQTPYTFDVAATVRRHIEILSKYFSERVVVNEMKKHVAAYLKGKRKAKSTVVAVENAKTVAEIVQRIDDFVKL